MLKVYPFLTVTYSCQETFTRRIYRYRQSDSQHAKKRRNRARKKWKRKQRNKGMSGPLLFACFKGICPFGHFFTLFNEVSVWAPKVSVWAPVYFFLPVWALNKFLVPTPLRFSVTAHAPAPEALSGVYLPKGGDWKATTGLIIVLEDFIVGPLTSVGASGHNVRGTGRSRGGRGHDRWGCCRWNRTRKHDAIAGPTS